MTQVFSDDAEVLDALDAGEVDALLRRGLDAGSVEEELGVDADDQEDGALIWRGVDAVVLREVDVPPETEGGIDSSIRPVRHHDARAVVTPDGGLLVESGGEAHMTDADALTEIEP